MTAWTISAQNRNGDVLGDVNRASGREFEFLLNRPSIASFSLPLNDEDTIRDRFRPGVSEFVVLRDGDPVETVFALTSAAVESSGDHPTLKVSGLGIASYLQDALVLGQASGWSDTNLPWEWIEDFQARTGGSYGITQGTQAGTPPTRYKTIAQDAALFQQITELAESGAGFDHAIDPLRRYREWHPTRGSNRGLVLEWGVNVSSFGYEENAGPGQIVNDIRVVGPDAAIAAKTASLAASRTLYGRREASIAYMADLETAAVSDSMLQNHADAAVDDHAYPLVIPDVTLDHRHESVAWGNWWLGDTVTFRANLASYVQIDALYRIVGVKVVLDDNNNPTISLTLNVA